MTPEQLLTKQRNELKKVLAKLPKENAKLTLQFIQSRFREQGWRNVYFKAWRPRSRNAKRNGNRALLVDSGRLRRSIRIIKTDGNTATVGTDVPYAEFHNQGFKGSVTVPSHARGKFSKSKVGTGKFTKLGNERQKTVKSLTGQSTVKAHTRKVNMPRRQFMGESAHLNKIIQRKMETEIGKIFK